MRVQKIVVVRTATAVLFLLPLFWMITAALHPQGEPLPQTLRLLPAHLTLDNFGQMWTMVPIGRFTLNSLFVTALAVPITLLIASWAGFGMAQLPRTSQRRWVLLSLAVLMVPGMALWFARFLLYKELGWLDSVWALIAPAWMGTSPFFVLLFYRAFRRIPRAVYEAARLDGAGILQTWALVALPMARATTIGVALLAFVFYWGDFISPRLYLSAEKLYTLPIGLQLMQQLNKSDWPLLMATAVWTAFIPALLFLLAQPYLRRK